MQNKYFPNLLSFEGIEGAGKGTQIELFIQFLKKSGLDVQCFREPGGTVLGEKVREALLGSKKDLHPLTEIHLLLASRIELLQEEILPRLKNPKNFVILDRYMHSTLAYQGYGRSLGVEMIQQMHSQEPLNTRPGLTFYLDIDWETSKARLAHREKDYFEKSSQEFFHAVRNGYHQINRQDPQHFKLIDGSGSVDKTQQLLQNIWSEYYNAIQ